MRNRNPEITNGTYTNLNLSVQKSVGGFIATLGDSSCIVIHNTGSSEATIDLTGYSDYKTINSYAGLGSAKLENGSLTIGQKTTVVLRKDYSIHEHVYNLFHYQTISLIRPLLLHQNYNT